MADLESAHKTTSNRMSNHEISNVLLFSHSGPKISNAILAMNEWSDLKSDYIIGISMSNSIGLHHPFTELCHHSSKIYLYCI